MQKVKSNTCNNKNHGNVQVPTCLTAMLIRKEFIDPSINTFSFSFLLITTGVNNSSLLLLKHKKKPEGHWSCIAHVSAEDMLN